MTWSFVAGTDLGNVHSGARSVTAGNLLITAYINGASGDVPTASDGVNTWTKISTTLADAGFNNSGTWWWAKATTTASITVAIANVTGVDEGMAILEWNSTAGAVPTDSLETNTRQEQNPGVTATDGTTSGSVSQPASNGDLFIGFGVNFQTGANSLTAGTGFTTRFTGTGGNAIRIEDLVQATAAAKAATWTNSGTEATGAFGAFFKEASGAATTWGPLLALKNNQLVGP